MTNDTLDKTTLLDVAKLQAELREAHRVLNAHGMGHYWTPNLDAFNNVALGILKDKLD